MSRSATSSRKPWTSALVVIIGAGLVGGALHLILASYTNQQAPAYVAAAERYIAVGQDARALTAIASLHNAQAAVARSQADLEQRNVSKAVSDLQSASGGAVASQRSLCQRVRAVMPDSALVLAQSLYADHLYRTTSRVLAKAPSSSRKYQLLADAELQLQPLTNQDLQTAQAAAGEGSALYPANLQLHQILESVDKQLNNTAGATQQAQLISELRTGTI
jgi:hypothetical protein